MRLPERCRRRGFAARRRRSCSAGLPRRRHRRVPPCARRRPAPLPGVLPPAPTRARPHRGDDRRRPRPPPAARRAGRPSRRRPADRSGSRCRPGSTPKIPSGGSPRRRASSPALRLGTGPGVRIDAAVAEGDVLAPGDRCSSPSPGAGPVPRRGPGSAAPGPGRDDGGHRRRQHEQGVPARCARPARGARGAGRQRLCRPPRRAAARSPSSATPTSPCSSPRSTPMRPSAAWIRLRFFASAHRGRPRTAPELGRTVELRTAARLPGAVTRPGPSTYAVELDGATATIRLDPLGPFERRMHLGTRIGADRVGRAGRRAPRRGRRHPSPVPPRRSGHRALADAGSRRRPARRRRRRGCRRRSGRRHREHEDGDRRAGAVHRPCPVPAHRTERAGRHGRRPRAARPDRAGSRRRHPAARLAVPAAGATTTPTPGHAAGATSTLLRGLVLGYDVDAAMPAPTAADLAAAWRALGPDPELVAAEQDLLVAFADLRVLFRACATRPTPTCRCAPRRSTSTPTSARSTSRARACRRRSWPPCAGRSATTASTTSSGRPRSRRRCTGSTSHSSGVAAQIPVVVDLLERWLEQGPQGDAVDDARRGTLDALVAATQRRHPVVADLAREVRFGIVDEPRLRRRPRRDLRGDGGPPRRPRRRPGGPEARRHMAELVDCPQPLAPLLLRRLAVDPPATRPVVLETMTRRYYRRRDPHDVRPLTVDGRDVVAAAMTAHRRRSAARARHRRPAVRVGGGRERARQRRRRHPGR